MQAPKVEMVPIEELRADPANPRRADPDRLDMVELSLSRLGWLLPVYITDDGLILSGHQRTDVAKRMGATHVPCVRIDIPEKRRPGINIVFNRATNDMQQRDEGEAMAEELASSIVIASAQHLPQLDPSNWDEWCPVLRVEIRSVAEVLERAGDWENDRHAVSHAAALRRNKVEMPIVVADDGKVLNGWGRLVRAAEAGETEIAVVECPAERGDLARLLLNRLSMDFALEDRYADILRYNSFRRARGRSEHLNYSMLALLYKMGADAKGNKKFKPMTLQFKFTPKEVELWKRVYGTCVVDFGAGLADKTKLLIEKVGVDAIPFEPYWTGGDDTGFAREEGRELNERFLERVASGQRFDTVFLCSILNSVPFRRDRELIVAILAALCYGHPRSQVVSGAVSHSHYEYSLKPQLSAALRAGANRFPLSYEPGVTLADVEKVPKMQKYHTMPEWRTLWGTQFTKVDVWPMTQGFLMAHCRNPKKPDVATLSEALAFEFELPFPDGTTLGLGEEAFAAFEKRLGIKLNRKFLKEKTG